MTDPALRFLPRTLAALVDERRLGPAGLDGDAEALTDGTRSVTWSGYVESVARLAGCLVSGGVDPGDRVAVRLGKSVDSFIAVHAVLRAGAVMVPVDPSAPVEFATAVIADAGATTLITDATDAVIGQLVAGAQLSRVVLAGGDPDRQRPHDAPCAIVTHEEVEMAPPSAIVEVDETAPAYIIYTSGSTGRPKGIVHTHRSALAYACAAAELYGLEATDRLANVAALHFDQSTFELYAAAIAGSTVVVLSDPILRFPASVTALLAAERVSVWYSVPTLLRQLSTRGAIEQHDLSSMRWILFGGEAFPSGQLADLMRQIPTARFSNVYGPAEVNQCTYYHLASPPSADVPVPIGRAWPGADLRIVDRDEPTLDVGPQVPGELLVHSDTMMACYWNQPALTATSVLELADSVGTVARWYRTGDIVVEQSDGDLMFLGRVDNQVKVRGHRIELEAVDLVLGDLVGVRVGTAVVRRVDGGDDELVALVVPEPETAPADVAAIVRQLRQRLPRAAVPSQVVIVDDLPRTGNGKSRPNCIPSTVGFVMSTDLLHNDNVRNIEVTERDQP